MRGVNWREKIKRSVEHFFDVSGSGDDDNYDNNDDNDDDNEEEGEETNKKKGMRGKKSTDKKGMKNKSTAKLSQGRKGALNFIQLADLIKNHKVYFYVTI